MTCKTFVLNSTVDVFKNPKGVDEDTPIEEAGLHAYGLHRRWLEKFVESHFQRHLIVRLPGLVGLGLRKNGIFDFLNDSNLHAIDSRGVFQFYPMVNLWYDIQVALDAGLKLVHLTAEPISVADVSAQGFGKPFEQAQVNSPAVLSLSQIAETSSRSTRWRFNINTLSAALKYLRCPLLLMVPLLNKAFGTK